MVWRGWRGVRGYSHRHPLAGGRGSGWRGVAWRGGGHCRRSPPRVCGREGGAVAACCRRHPPHICEREGPLGHGGRGVIVYTSHAFAGGRGVGSSSVLGSGRTEEAGNERHAGRRWGVLGPPRGGWSDGDGGEGEDEGEGDGEDEDEDEGWATPARVRTEAARVEVARAKAARAEAARTKTARAGKATKA
ncbi:hypothetical protein BC826DRAFT_1178525 [Russula brevipes]|nr:hypothetical protein BC826DRAFT_1178525 [Russula brevipes]